MQNAVTNTDYYLHIVRNPHGYCEDDLRTARLYICNVVDSLSKQLSSQAEQIRKLEATLKSHNETENQTISALQARIAEAEKPNLVLEATDYMHAVSVLFTPQPEGDVLAERRPSKDVKAYNAFIYLSTQGKRLRDAIDGTISITSQRELELLAVIEQMIKRLDESWVPTNEFKKVLTTVSNKIKES